MDDDYNLRYLRCPDCTSNFSVDRSTDIEDEKCPVCSLKSDMYYYFNEIDKLISSLNTRIAMQQVQMDYIYDFLHAKSDKIH